LNKIRLATFGKQRSALIARGGREHSVGLPHLVPLKKPTVSATPINEPPNVLISRARAILAKEAAKRSRSQQTGR
jgi:hypothetical protein